MKFIYPAIIKKIGEGKYRALLPDLEGCEAYGESVDDVLENANAAMYTWIETELEDENGQLPNITDISDIIPKEDEIIRNVCVTMRFYEGWDE